MIMNGNAATNQMVPGTEGYVNIPRQTTLSSQKAGASGYPDGFKVYLDAPNGRYPSDAQVARQWQAN